MNHSYLKYIISSIMNVFIETNLGVMIRHYETGWNGACISFEIGEDESNRNCFRVQNACGVVLVSSMFIHKEHPAWRTTPSIFGIVRKAFSVAGNFIMQKNKISFKGASDPRILKERLKNLICSDFSCNLQLFVASIGIGRSLKVDVGCLLEKKLYQYKWIHVMSRIQEICNVIVFYIKDWQMMCQCLNINLEFPSPKSCTISVTRRGTVTIRITWEKFLDWNDNACLKLFCEAIAGFVRMNV